MTEREELEGGIAALEAQRAVLGDAVVDIALAALRARRKAPESDGTGPVRGAPGFPWLVLQW
jgi:hypothetical protein